VGAREVVFRGGRKGERRDVENARMSLLRSFPLIEIGSYKDFAPTELVLFEKPQGPPIPRISRRITASQRNAGTYVRHLLLRVSSDIIEGQLLRFLLVFGGILGEPIDHAGHIDSP
jgi:hypothetical protein